MRNLFELLIHIFFTLLKLTKPGEVKAIVAENIAMRQQLIMVSRRRKRASNLTASDRFIFVILAGLVSPHRLQKISAVIKPATILKFHKALVDKKYQILYSQKSKIQPGRKGPTQEMIDLVISIKQKTPRYGYRRIAMQIYQSFGINISRFAVGRIIRNHYNPGFCGNNDGPSRLTFIGNMKDSLWSVDFFKCESIALKTHTVMTVMDQYSRRIIGFAAETSDHHVGNPCGVDFCHMFNSIISEHSVLPKYLSTDNDPLFEFHRWQANLRILEIDEIKSVPYTPEYHPFIERVIGSTRREFLDHTLSWNLRDLLKKLNHYKDYYNQIRGHGSIIQLTPDQQADNQNIPMATKTLSNYHWQSHCNSPFHTPMAA